MRWLFFDPATKEERRRRASAVEAIDRFWSAFTDRAGAIDAQLSGGPPALDLDAFLAEHLRPVHDGLTWSTGPAVLGQGHRLVVGPARDEALRPLVATLVERAPALPRFEVHAYRPPEGDPARVLARVSDGLGLPARGLRGRFTPGAGHRLDLAVTCPGLALEAVRAAGLIAADALLGELEAVTWVGAVTSHEPGAAGEWHGVEALEAAFASARARVIEALPAQPSHGSVDPSTWPLIKRTPVEADDYPRQADLLMAKTKYLEMWRAASSGQPFSSARFSRHGEVFCYLKLDRPDAGDAEEFPDKGHLESAVESALASERLGGYLGSGTGLRYSYLELALRRDEVPRAAAAIKGVLRRGHVPVRSWLLFHDDAWRDEWIGVWGETPPPPR